MASRSPTREVERHPVEYVVPLAVGEAQVLPDQVRTVRPVGPGSAVLGHLRDAQQPARRGDPHLQPVHLTDQPVERAAQGLDVQQRGGDLPGRDPPALVAVAADEQGDHARRVERDVDHGEEQVPQRHGVALGLSRHRHVVVAGAHAEVGQPERLDGPGALGGLGEGGVDPGVRRALGDVALRRPLQVAAYLEPRRADHEQRRHREQHRVEQHGDDGERDGQARDDRLRYAELHRATHRADVAGHARDQVTGRGALDPSERQAQHGPHDELARRRQQVLTEDRRGALRQERQHCLGADDRDDHPREVVEAAQLGSLGPARDEAVHEVAQQARYDECRRSRERVEHDQPEEDALALTEQPAEERHHHVVVGHRPAAHRVARRGVRVQRALFAQQVAAMQRREPVAPGHAVRGRDQLGWDRRLDGRVLAPGLRGGRQRVRQDCAHGRTPPPRERPSRLARPRVGTPGCRAAGPRGCRPRSPGRSRRARPGRRGAARAGTRC